jgi:hypothetical protein
MRLSELSILSCLCLATASVAAASPASPDPAKPAAAPPAPASCWTITGPFADGKESYFEAKNGCDAPRHCQVWVNGQEPSHMIHLEAGTSGRIDVGAAEPGDKYSQDCTPIGIYGEHGD